MLLWEVATCSVPYQVEDSLYKFFLKSVHKFSCEKYYIQILWFTDKQLAGVNNYSEGLIKARL
jgi:hypothetical protein